VILGIYDLVSEKKKELQIVRALGNCCCQVDLNEDVSVLVLVFWVSLALMAVL